MKHIAALAVAFLAALPSSASIALFTDGRSMKVTGYKLLDQNTIQLQFKNNGWMSVPLSRVERIVDDEIVDVEKAPEVKKMIEEGAFPKRTWRYDAARGPIFRSKYDTMIIEAAKKFDVDAGLVSAVIKAESDFNAGEISDKGARGLMQLMPATAERFGVIDSFNARANISGGVRYLRWLLDTFSQNADLAVAAYNAGEGNVWKYNGVPPFRETLNYVKRISSLVRVALKPEPAASAASVLSAPGQQK